MSEAQIVRRTQVIGGTPNQAYVGIKRVVEPLLVGILLIAALPLMVLIAVVIMVDSPGSFLYIQERIGKNGRPFRMYKFRTMVDHEVSEEQKYMADYVAGRVKPHFHADGTVTYKSAHPAQVTRIGRFLRKSSLDELPQLWNILRGEMSLIGPRPNLPCEVAQYSERQHQRLAVLPGITGLAQIRGRSNITFEQIVDHDLEYIRNQSLKLDLQILFWTGIKVLYQADVGEGYRQ